MRLSRSALAPGLAAVALGAGLLGPSPAAATPTWLSAAALSKPGHNAENPQVSVDAHGDALAVWARYDEKTNRNVIEASGRPAGSGSWQAPVTISNTSEEASSPQVGLDSSGDAVVLWEGYDGIEYSVEAATRTGLTGAWQPPVTLRMLGAVIQPSPDLAVDAKGDAVAVWERTEASTGIVEAAYRPAGSGSWQAPATLSEEAEVQYRAEAAIDAEGEATAVWEQREGAEVRIAAAGRPPGGKWQIPILLSPAGKNANEPRVVADARGDAVAVWERPNGEEIIEAATKPALSAVWGKPAALTQPEGTKGEPANQAVGIDGQGDAVVAWSRTHTAGHDFVEATEGQVSSSAWQPPVSLSGSGGVTEEKPAVGVNDEGDAVVAWERPFGGNEIVEAAAGQAAGGSWQAPVTLSAAGENATEQQVALDAQGNAAAVWSRFDGKVSNVAEAAGYDAAGPQLGSLAIPSAGTVGQTLSFSVSPFDVWSALGTTSWSFGDGTSQTGTGVAHAYLAPGTYTVTVTSTDAVANATSTHATVTIAAAASAGGQSQPLQPHAALAPRITAAGLSNSRFRVSPHPTAVSAKAGVPQGTTFHFTLSEAARLRIGFEHSVAGLRSGGRCVAPSARLRHKRAKRCTRTLTIGALARASEPGGADSLAFSGRIGTRALAPGAYRAVLTASAGALSSAPVTLSLTVVH